MRGPFIAFVLFLFLSVPASAEENHHKNQSETVIIDASSQFALAQYFFKEGDYFRAITEYKKLIFFFPKSNLLEMAYFKIGEAYFNGKKWKQALAAFQKYQDGFPNGNLIDRSFYLSGMAYFHNREYHFSRAQFRKIINDFPKSTIIDETRLQIAMSYVDEEKWHDAILSFREIEEGSHTYQPSMEFAAGLEKIEELPLKSPALAGTLAAVLPGSGHFYTGRKRDGTTAFLLNGAFIWGALEAYDDEEYVVAGILTFFELGWYFGNIYSAVSSAHKYNRHQKDSYIRSLKERIDISLGAVPVHKAYYLVLHFCF